MNRDFRPIVEEQMEPVYDQCKNDRGTGVTKRRKAYLETHVEQHRETMFQQSTSSVKGLLDALLRESRKIIEEKVDENILATLKRDYLSAFGWDGDVQLLPKADRVMRGDVQEKVLAAEELYQRVVDPDDLMEDAFEEDKNSAMKTGSDEDVDEIRSSKHAAAATEGKTEGFDETQTSASPSRPPTDEDDTTEDQQKPGSHTKRTASPAAPSPSLQKQSAGRSNIKLRDSGIGIREDSPAESAGESPPPRREGEIPLQDKALSTTNKMLGGMDGASDEKIVKRGIPRDEGEVDDDDLPSFDFMMRQPL